MNGNDPAMNPDAQREAALFQAAAQLTGATRASFLDGACHSNPDLRQRLEALLAAHEQSEGVLAEPAPTGTLKTGTTTIGAAVTEQAGDCIGPYKLREKIGEGGCGVVYVAEQAKYQRDGIERLIRLYEAWPRPDQLAECKEKLAALDEDEATKNKPVLP